MAYINVTALLFPELQPITLLSNALEFLLLAYSASQMPK